MRNKVKYWWYLIYNKYIKSESTKYLEEVLQIAKEIQRDSQALKELFSKSYNSVDFEYFYNNLDLFMPTMINSDGVMANLQHKSENELIFVLHYAEGAKLCFHKYSNADERILHIKGNVKSMMYDEDNNVDTTIPKRYSLTHVKQGVYHQWVANSKAISIVILNKI